MTYEEKLQRIREAIQNSRENGYEPDLMSEEDLAVDLWMSSECEGIPEKERLEIVGHLRALGT